METETETKNEMAELLTLARFSKHLKTALRQFIRYHVEAKIVGCNDGVVEVDFCGAEFYFDGAAIGDISQFIGAIPIELMIAADKFLDDFDWDTVLTSGDE